MGFGGEMPAAAVAAADSMRRSSWLTCQLFSTEVEGFMMSMGLTVADDSSAVGVTKNGA